MSDTPYKPYLSKEQAHAALDKVYDFQVDYVDRPTLGESGPREIPLTPARHAALAIFNNLSHRSGLDIKEIVGYDPELIAEIVDETTDVIVAAFDLGEGPVTVETARELNQLHAEGRDWIVDYDAGKKRFAVAAEPVSGGLDHVTSDSLFEAVQTARKQSSKEPNNE